MEVNYDHLISQKLLCTCLEHGREEGRQGSDRPGSALFVGDVVVFRLMEK